MEHKSILWIGILLLVGWLSLKNPDILNSITKSLGAPSNTSQTKANADPYAGTTRSREYQQAWEKARAESDARWAETGGLPPQVLNYIRSQPSHVGK